MRTLLREWRGLLLGLLLAGVLFARSSQAHPQEGPVILRGQGLELTAPNSKARCTIGFELGQPKITLYDATGKSRALLTMNSAETRFDLFSKSGIVYLTTWPSAEVTAAYGGSNQATLTCNSSGPIFNAEKNVSAHLYPKGEISQLRPNGGIWSLSFDKRGRATVEVDQYAGKSRVYHP